jgi:hypothetical protein
MAECHWCPSSHLTMVSLSPPVHRCNPGHYRLPYHVQSSFRRCSELLDYRSHLEQPVPSDLWVRCWHDTSQLEDECSIESRTPFARHGMHIDEWWFPGCFGKARWLVQPWYSPLHYPVPTWTHNEYSFQNDKPCMFLRLPFGLHDIRMVP